MDRSGGEITQIYTHTHTHTHTHKLVKWPPTISELCHKLGDLSMPYHGGEAVREIGCFNSSAMLNCWQWQQQRRTCLGFNLDDTQC